MEQRQDRGTVGAPFAVADIFVEDQGTDGLGAGKNWAGFKNATDFAQSHTPNDSYVYTGDTIKTLTTPFAIGTCSCNTATWLFNGLIDYVRWNGVADYSGVDDTPIPPQ